MLQQIRLPMDGFRIWIALPATNPRQTALHGVARKTAVTDARILAIFHVQPQTTHFRNHVAGMRRRNDFISGSCQNIRRQIEKIARKRPCRMRFLNQPSQFIVAAWEFTIPAPTLAPRQIVRIADNWENSRELIRVVHAKMVATCPAHRTARQIDAIIINVEFLLHEFDRRHDIFFTEIFVVTGAASIWSEADRTAVVRRRMTLVFSIPAMTVHRNDQRPFDGRIIRSRNADGIRLDGSVDRRHIRPQPSAPFFQHVLRALQGLVTCTHDHQIRVFQLVAIIRIVQFVTDATQDVIDLRLQPAGPLLRKPRQMSRPPAFMVPYLLQLVTIFLRGFDHTAAPSGRRWILLGKTFVNPYSIAN